MAYGQTGSGKTFTMSGREEVVLDEGYRRVFQPRYGHGAGKKCGEKKVGDVCSWADELEALADSSDQWARYKSGLAARICPSCALSICL